MVMIDKKLEAYNLTKINKLCSSLTLTEYNDIKYSLFGKNIIKTIKYNLFSLRICYKT